MHGEVVKISKFLADGMDACGTHYAPGEWNAIDDITGFQHKASELGLQWDGLMVADVEERHPQDYLRAIADRINVPWARPDNSTFRTTDVTADDL